MARLSNDAADWGLRNSTPTAYSDIREDPTGDRGGKDGVQLCPYCRQHRFTCVEVCGTVLAVGGGSLPCCDLGSAGRRR